jgi:hypothetical protein
VARSNDSGRTWAHTTNASPSTTAFFPEIAVAGDGTVGVTWYDDRKARPDESTWPMDVYFASSRDHGSHWNETKVAGPMDLHTEQPRYGAGAALNIGQGSIWLGDYTGLVGLPHGFAAAFTVTKPIASDGATDIDFAEIGLRTQARPKAWIRLPSNRKCLSRRRIAVRFLPRPSDPIRMAAISENGRRVTRLRGKQLMRAVTLKVDRQRLTLSIVAHTQNGHTLTISRTYKACGSP